MDTCRNIFLSHVSALACWAVIGHKGLLPQTQTDIRDAKTAAKNPSTIFEEGLLESGFIQKLPKPLDVLVPAHGRTFKSDLFTCHLREGELPSGSLRRLTEHVFISSPDLTFVQLGTVLTDVQLATVGMMLCGNYSIAPNEERKLLERKPLTSLYSLKHMVDQTRRFHGSTTARRAIDMCLEGSRSPRESIAPLLISLPPMMGGYDLEQPELNRKVHLSPAAAAIVGMSEITPDLCWFDRKTLLEYDSWENHQDGMRLSNDDLRIQAFVKDDWTALTLRTENMNDSVKFDRIVRGVLAPALGARVPSLTQGYMNLQRELRDEVMSFDPYVSSSEARKRLRYYRQKRKSIGFGESRL